MHDITTLLRRRRNLEAGLRIIGRAAGRQHPRDIRAVLSFKIPHLSPEINAKMSSFTVHLVEEAPWKVYHVPRVHHTHTTSSLTPIHWK